MTAVRPSLNTVTQKYECRRGYEGCGESQGIDYVHSAETVTCVPEGTKEEECPITKLEFVPV